MMKTFSTLIAMMVLGLSIGNSQINISFSTNTGNGQKNKQDKNQNKNQNNQTTTNGNSGQADASFDPANCSIKITPSNLAYTIDVKARVLNNKNKIIPAGTKLNFYLTKSATTIATDDLLLSTYSIPDDICANCYVGYTNNINLAYQDYQLTEAGNYYLAMRIDDGNQVTETDETNNEIIINTLIEYKVPEGVIQFNQESARKKQQDNFRKENAGKILFTLGKLNMHDDVIGNHYVTHVSFKDLIDANGTKDYELGFAAFFQNSIGQEYEKYRKQGMNPKEWTDDYWSQLYFKLIIDSNDTIISAHESDPISTKSTYYGITLTGVKTGTSNNTVHLRNIVLEELYKLKPGVHHLELQLFVKTDGGVGYYEVGPNPMAKGELNVTITSEDKINHFKKWNELKPRAKMTNSTLEGQMKQFMVNYYAETDMPISLTDFKYFVIVDSDWEYEKSYTGAILSRSISTHSILQYKDGTCGFIWMKIGEDYQGGGNYSKPGFSAYESGGCIPCEALK